MENTRTANDLAYVISDVLGGMAFLVNDDEAPEITAGAVWLKCEVAYRGPFSGHLSCWCSQDFAVQLTANVLGLETDDPLAQEQCQDGLREFMNVLCGQFVTAWHGTQAVFDLSIPTVTPCPETPQLNAAVDDLVCQLAVSGEPFYCRYQPRA